MAEYPDRITDAELLVMRALWQAKGPLTTARLTKILFKSTGWKASTVKTLVRRLLLKGALAPDPALEHHYRPLISRGAYGLEATRMLLETVYEGDANRMVRAVKQAGSEAAAKKGFDRDYGRGR